MSNLMLVEKVKDLPDEYVDAVAACIDKLMSRKKSARGIASKYANVILRYLLDDVPEMAEKANEIIKDGAYTTPEILAEVLYVLIKVYKVEKREACSFVKSVLDELSVDEKAAVEYALDLHSAKTLDFVDCLIVARHNIHGVPVFCFEKKLMKELA